ncbi:MAG: ATP-binding protein [Patescibacteria group bacterium]|nr:ATP-binding protein [Patescibacteria group bacterium]
MVIPKIFPITRFILKQIEEDLFKGKIVVIYGPRQAGKTTLVRQILEGFSGKFSYFNCDEPDIRLAFADKTSSELKQLIGNTDIVVLDEAQRVKNIGLTLKLLVDTYPNLQVVATGSSSFELADKIAEPLTGRSFKYTLFPLSEMEIVDQIGLLEAKRTVETRLMFGSYPEIYMEQDVEKKQRLLTALKSDYMLADILKHENIKGPDVLYKILQAIALQIGKEVSLNEISSLVGVDKSTVARYIDILEKGFIVFRLGAFSRNLRKEISQKDKIFFYDVGLRNALINNFNPMGLRQDKGDIWENFVISERLKRNAYKRDSANMYFWRTYDQQELDLIEEKQGGTDGYEIKWKSDKFRYPKAFLDAYPNSETTLITRENYLDFVT